MVVALGPQSRHQTAQLNLHTSWSDGSRPLGGPGLRYACPSVVEATSLPLPGALAATFASPAFGPHVPFLREPALEWALGSSQPLSTDGGSASGSLQCVMLVLSY